MASPLTALSVLLLVAAGAVGFTQDGFDPDCPEERSEQGDTDPDDPCVRSATRTSTPPPAGPSVVLYGSAGEDITFHCDGRGPCAKLIVNATGGARSFVMLQWGDGMVGGYGVDAFGLTGVPRESWAQQCEQDHWCLSGDMLSASGAVLQTARQVPYGEAGQWHFTFHPMGGVPPADLTVRIEFSDGPAPVPGWAPDRQCIPCD